MAARRTTRRNTPRRRRTPAARPVGYGPSIRPFVRERNAGIRYTARWHQVLQWVILAIAQPGFDEVKLTYPRKPDAGRVERRAASHVRDLANAEEAYEEGIPLEMLRLPGGAPNRWRGGVRRVVVTALTWVIDAEGEVGYDPAWITLGHGMTARQAAANASRFIRDYQRALVLRLNSRTLIFTALEVKFWTASAGTSYV